VTGSHWDPTWRRRETYWTGEAWSTRIVHVDVLELGWRAASSSADFT
jgi:hypothetical protein